MRLDSEDIDHNAVSYTVTIKDFELLIVKIITNIKNEIDKHRYIFFILIYI